MKMIKPIVNLSKIANDYDTFVFGFNGVLYDGQNILQATTLKTVFIPLNVKINI